MRSRSSSQCRLSGCCSLVSLIVAVSLASRRLGQALGHRRILHDKCSGLRSFVVLMWPSVQRMLYETASSHGAHDAAARGEFLCSGQEFAQRSRAWKEKLSGVIRGADTEHITSQVSQVWVPASGADVLSAFAAFPAAREYTFISREGMRSNDLQPACLARSCTCIGRQVGT